MRASLLLLVLVASGCHREADSSRNPAAAAPPASAAPVAAPVAAAAEGTPREKPYRLEVTTPPCAPREPCEAVVTLVATSGFHINDEYPYRFVGDAVPAVELLGRDGAGAHVFSKAAGDFAKEGETRARLSVRYRAKEAGSLPLTGTYKLSVCSAETCLLATEKIATTVVVR